MADEISVTIKSTLSNGQLKRQFSPGAKTYDQQDAQWVGRTITLTTNSTTLDVGDLASNKGWCFCTNQSTANEVILGPTSDSPFVRVFPAADEAFGLVAGTTIKGKTLSGTASFSYDIWST